MESKFTDTQIEKVRKSETVEELAEMAMMEGIELTTEEAENFFEQISIENSDYEYSCDDEGVIRFF